VAGVEGEREQLSRPADWPGSFVPWLVQWLVITALFAAAASWPVPDVNEAHYLPKAKHAADPSWCPGDFFLSSAEAHGLFFRLLGPVTTTFSLTTAAWLGRWLGWLALAAGFQHAAAALGVVGMRRLLAAATFSLAARYTTMAGEWMLGGCEAKVFAWAAVLVAWGELAAGRWGSSWLFSGLAAALHPLVGGWMMLVTVVTRGIERLTGDPDRTLGQPRPGDRLWASISLAGGLGLAAVGLVPAALLSSGVPLEIQREAAMIYVAERLPHHLLPRSFQVGLVSRHILAIVVWWILAGLQDESGRLRRSRRMTLVVISLSALGWLVSLAEPFAPALTHGLLRFYWFRLADGLVPLALALTAVLVLWPAASTTDGRHAPAEMPWQSMLLRALLLLLVVDLVLQSAHWPLPGRHFAARSDKRVAADDWLDVCEWVKHETPADALFLTPRGAASFHWRAERPEVVCWKNIPQDPAAIVEWRQRIVDCFSTDGTLTGQLSSTASLGVKRLNEVAKQYAADFVIAPRKSLTSLPDGQPAVYQNATYVVLPLPLPDQAAH
jgi:hypothetical protein